MNTPTPTPTSDSASARTSTTTTTTTTTTPPGEPTSALDRAIDAVEQLEVQHDRAQEMLAALVAEASKGTITWNKNVTSSIRAGIKLLDQALSEQLAAIMRAPELLQLEGSWRGLHHLVFQSETCRTLKVKVLNISKRELFNDLDTAMEFDASALWKMVYRDEFDQPGGQPLGVMIGDYEFENHPEDITLLGHVSKVAAGAFCPFISAASPKLLDLKSFADLHKPHDLERTFLSKEYIKWNSFRDTKDSRFVSLVMPRVLARLPYGEATARIPEFNFEEGQQDPDGRALPMKHEHYCWMNAAYVYGARLTASFSRTNWCTEILGAENGGAISNLPLHTFVSPDGDWEVKCPTEAPIPGRRDAELSKLGFMPLCWYKDNDYAVFFDGQTVRRPDMASTDPNTRSNERISAYLPYMLTASRIAHYLQAIARDKRGSFMEASDCQKWLTRWIMQFRLADENPSEEMKKRFPLREVSVEVKDDPEKPGVYNATILMRPWLYMVELNASLSMVANLPKDKK